MCINTCLKPLQSANSFSVTFYMAEGKFHLLIEVPNSRALWETVLGVVLKCAEAINPFNESSIRTKMRLSGRKFIICATDLEGNRLTAFPFA